MRHGRWEVVKELGKGGQGVVSLAIDSDKIDLEKLSTDLVEAVARISAVTTVDQVRPQSLSLLNILESYFNRNNARNTGALKVLHPELLKDSKARERLETEVRLLSKLDIHLS
jgi:serine/threonine protein kinase